MLNFLLLPGAKSHHFTGVMVGLPHWCYWRVCSQATLPACKHQGWEARGTCCETGTCEGAVYTAFPRPLWRHIGASSFTPLPPCALVGWLEQARGFSGGRIYSVKTRPFLRPSVCRLLCPAWLLSTCSSSPLFLSFLLEKGLGQKVLVHPEPEFGNSKAKKGAVDGFYVMPYLKESELQ